MAVVRWQEMTSAQVYNLHRALSSVYPLTTTWHGLPVRLYCATPAMSSAPGGERCRPGCVQYLRSAAALRVLCADQRWVHFVSVGVPNKKPLSATEFYNGYLSKKKESERIFT
ncbi:hypothetical protein PR048_028441 [Dryococelus australis]|uniref:Formyl transferase C-terminal domain-containing protein n=1 Tax=Dryococelus australis TaxID=614101 RepID=A0ABQ9GAN7_9NEOP|nr:hypothetical protein PR048_028441 [Dryococelus australis]